MTAQEATVIISLVGLISVAINVYVGLRLAAMQAKIDADSATLRAELLKQFVVWKDEVLGAINGKYVSEKLIVEIRSGIGREIGLLATRIDRMDERCERRYSVCPARTRESQEYPPTVGRPAIPRLGGPPVVVFPCKQ
jgi:hypothetical protein